jgi:ankyrin repeat protein
VSRVAIVELLLLFSNNAPHFEARGALHTKIWSILNVARASALVDVDCATVTRDTALMLAAEGGSISVVRCLLTGTSDATNLTCPIEPLIAPSRFRQYQAFMRAVNQLYASVQWIATAATQLLLPSTNSSTVPGASSALTSAPAIHAAASDSIATDAGSTSPTCSNPVAIAPSTTNNSLSSTPSASSITRFPAHAVINAVKLIRRSTSVPLEPISLPTAPPSSTLFYDTLHTIVAHRGNERDSQGRTPLYCAVQYDHVHTARLLVNLGVDVNVCDTDPAHGLTPLHLAISLRSIKLLLVCVRDPMRLTHRLFALRVVPQCLILTMSVVFLSQLVLSAPNIDVNAKDANGDTPLVYALRYKVRSLVHPLLSCHRCKAATKMYEPSTASRSQVDPNIASGEGVLPLQLAINLNDLKLVQMLLYYGATISLLPVYDAIAITNCHRSQN